MSKGSARPCNIAWIRSILKQCKAATVPCFVKQLGAKPIMVLGGQQTSDGTRTFTPGPTWKIRDPKGGDPAEWPEEVRVREYPEVRHA